MTLQETAKNIENKLHGVANSKATKNIKEGVEDVKEASADVKEGLDTIKNGVEGLVNLTMKDAKEKYATMEESLGDYLKAHPLKAIGLVLVAGFALSKFL